MPRKLFTSKEIFFTLMEFNDYYFHFFENNNHLNDYNL